MGIGETPRIESLDITMPGVNPGPHLFVKENKMFDLTLGFLICLVCLKFKWITQKVKKTKWRPSSDHLIQTILIIILALLIVAVLGAASYLGSNIVKFVIVLCSILILILCALGVILHF